MRRTLSILLPLFLLLPQGGGAAEEEYLSYSSSAEKWLFRELPHHLIGDLKETFWNQSHLIALAAGIGATAALHEADPEIQGKFHPGDPMGGAKDVFNIMGNSLVLGGSTLLTTAVTKLAGHEKAAWTAGTMLEALSLNYAFTYLLKFSTQRSRPDGSNDLSFPSGHASGTFALATVTEVFYGPLWGIPSYALAGAIAISRIDANKHVASDTLAGAILGTAIGLGTAKFHKKKKSDLFVVPSVVESGMVVNLVRLF